MEQLQSLSLLWGAPIIMAFISGVYFITYPRNSNLGERLLVSAHGASAAILNLSAMLIGAVGASALWLAWPYLLAQLIPVALVIVAIIRFKGPRFVHVLQPFNLLCMFWAYFIGAMAITGEWL